MKAPTMGQLKTLGAYLFVIGTGAYIGAEYWGLAGGVVGAVLAVPVGIVIGMAGLDCWRRYSGTTHGYAHTMRLTESMPFNHETIKDVTQSERREKALMGDTTLVCDCGKEFEIRKGDYQGSWLAVATDVVD